MAYEIKLSWIKDNVLDSLAVTRDTPEEARLAARESIYLQGLDPDSVHWEEGNTHEKSRPK